MHERGFYLDLTWSYVIDRMACSAVRRSVNAAVAKDRSAAVAALGERQLS